MTGMVGHLARTSENDTQFPWFALQVRVRRESSVVDYLRANGYDLFLPLYRTRKRWSDRIKEVYTPLFPGYLFCRFNPDFRLPILKTPGVIGIVSCNRVPASVNESEVAAVRTFLASRVQCQPWPFLKLGDRVRVDSGPLLGLEGILIEHRGSHRLIISVTLLQRSVAVEIEAAFVSPLRTSSVQFGARRDDFNQLGLHSVA